MPREARRIAGSEAAAFEKLDSAMAHAVEALTEIGWHRGGGAWMHGAILMDQLQKKFAVLKTAGRMKGDNLELDKMIAQGRRGG